MNQDAECLIALLSGRAISSDGLNGSDWERIIELARQHDIAQLLPACLKARSIVPPPAAADRIRKIYLSSATRNTRLYHELKKILQAFQAAGITIVPLKGAWLAESVYTNIALRTMEDVDLWVQRNQIEAACEIMHSLGYSSQSIADRPQALQEALGGETKMFKANAPMVELHWNIFPGEWLRHTARIDEQVIWQRTVPLHGEQLRQLMPEDAIIHLCVHLAVNHQMTRSVLRTLVDLDYARRTLSVDWDIVVRQAREWHVSCATWMVLQLLADVFGDPGKQLPLHDIAPSFLRRSILRQLVSLRSIVEELRRGRDYKKRYIIYLALIDSPVDAIALLWQAVFPDRIWVTLRYGLQDAPSWRIWLQRFWHPVRIISRRKNRI